MAASQDWLEIVRGDEPLIVSLPHTGTSIPAEIAPNYASDWLVLKDTDWHIEHLYGFAAGLGATVIRTAISRSVIDVNRDPSGASLYPGQTTTELCPTTTFDGEKLYREGMEPDPAEVQLRRERWFDPYHQAISAEIARLRAKHAKVVLYDCHSIRSVIPRLFDGELPEFNIGTNGGAAASADLTASIESICASTGKSHVVNGRFRGGHITRSHGTPLDGVHAVQMELACRAYLREPIGPVSSSNWPPSYDPAFSAPLTATLRDILLTCIQFAKT